MNGKRVLGSRSPLFLYGLRLLSGQARSTIQRLELHFEGAKFASLGYSHALTYPPSRPYALRERLAR